MGEVGWGQKGGGRRTNNSRGRSPLTTHFMKKLIRVTALSHFRPAHLSEAEQMKALMTPFLDIEVSDEEEDADEEIGMKWMLGWAKNSKDKTVADVISKMIMAYKLQLSDVDLSKKLEELLASCAEKQVEVNYNFQSGSQYAENIENQNINN